MDSLDTLILFSCPNCVITQRACCTAFSKYWLYTSVSLYWIYWSFSFPGALFCIVNKYWIYSTGFSMSYSTFLLLTVNHLHYVTIGLQRNYQYIQTIIISRPKLDYWWWQTYWNSILLSSILLYQILQQWIYSNSEKLIYCFLRCISIYQRSLKINMINLHWIHW